MSGAGTKKLLFAENGNQGMYMGISFNLICYAWLAKKIVLSTENIRRGWYKKAPLSQYVRRGCYKKDLFIGNLKRGLYKESP